MAKRNTNDGVINDKPAAKLYGVPPPLGEDLVKRLQAAVEAARREKDPQPQRSINPFLESPPQMSELDRRRD